MEKSVDYSLQYKRWHKGTLNELDERSVYYANLLKDELSNISPNSKILDYGCGFGELTYFLLKRFNNVIGVDASIEQIDVAKKLKLPVELVPIQKFDDWCIARNGLFDVIFLMDVLEHIPVQQQIYFMRSLNSLLSPNGTIYIKVPNANSMLAPRWRYIDWTHLSSFTECSLEFICLNSGFADFIYLKDDSSLRPKLWLLPRFSTIRFYLKSLFRTIWRLYLYAEHGKESFSFPVGLNIFVKAKKH